MRCAAEPARVDLDSRHAPSLPPGMPPRARFAAVTSPGHWLLPMRACLQRPGYANILPPAHTAHGRHRQASLRTTHCYGC